MKKSIIIGVLVILVIGAGIFLGGSRRSTEVVTSGPAPGQMQRPAPTVSVATVAEQDLNELISFHGRFAANSQVGVIPKVAGRVGEVFVQVGDTVRTGEPILQLETEELALQVRQAQAALQAAQANLSRVKSGARAEEVEQAEAGFRQAQANYNSVKLNYDRSQTLFKEGVISAREWEGVQAQYEVANAQLVNAEKTLALVRQGAREEDIRSTEASVAQAQVALELAQLSLRNATITSPIAGRISRVSVEKGGMAGSGMAVATVVDISTVKLHLQVTGRDVARMRPGQMARITVDALPNHSFPGIVATISPAAEEGSGMFAVTVEVENPDGILLPGMYGAAQIVIEQRTDVATVPARAIATSGGRSQVFVVEDNIVRLVPVETGITSGNLVEIRSGVNVGDRVVVTGRESVRDGMTVQVTDGSDNR